MIAPNVTTPVRRYLGLTTERKIDSPIHLVLQRPDGGLAVLEMPFDAALALSLDIRIKLGQHAAPSPAGEPQLEATLDGMAVWSDPETDARITRLVSDPDRARADRTASIIATILTVALALVLIFKFGILF